MIILNSLICGEVVWFDKNIFFLVYLDESYVFFF